MNKPAHREGEAQCKPCSPFSILDIWRIEALLRYADGLCCVSLENTWVATG